MDESKLVVVITGCTNGIGRSAAKRFATSGRVGTLIIGNRNREAGQSLAEELKALSDGLNVSHEDLDLASLKSVKAFADKVSGKVDHVDVLVCNGGLGGIDGLTKDGFEMQFGVNTLSHQLLTKLLEPLLLNSQPTPTHFFPRIVNVSSEGSLSSQGMRFDVFKPESGSLGPAPALSEMFRRYSDSKLGQILLAKEWSRRLNGIDSSPGAMTASKPAKVATLALHPGFVYTNGFKNAPSWIQWLLPAVWVVLRPFGAILNEDEGCNQTIQCALDADADLEAAYQKGLAKLKPEEREKIGSWWHGSYFDGGVGKAPNPIAVDETACAALFDKCNEWLK